jgi:putative transposase
VSERTLRRWRESAEDGRPNAERAVPTNALTQEERLTVLTLCNLPENKDLPPGQIVPALADKEIYFASESTSYRILRAFSQLNHRGRARAPKNTPKPVHATTAPNQVWVWDITYLKTSVAGIYMYLYIIMDLHSRKIVAHETWESENAEHSRKLLRRASLSENIAANSTPVILHGDNGRTLKY